MLLVLAHSNTAGIGALSVPANIIDCNKMADYSIIIYDSVQRCRFHHFVKMVQQSDNLKVTPSVSAINNSLDIALE